MSTYTKQVENILKYVALSEIEISETNKLFRDDGDLTEAALQELIDSIKTKGVIQPVLLRPKGGKFELICGERRFRASKIAGLNEVPALIRSLNDEEALEAQAVENMQREDVNPMKQAAAFEWMVKTKKMSAQGIANKIGKSIDYVQDRIKLNTLHADVKALVKSHVLPLKAALKIASVPQNQQPKVIDDCVTEIEGANGKTFVFQGMDQLKNYLEYNIFNSFEFADFDTTDAQLVPSAGACTLCAKRTKNAGGLFDDIAKKDNCLDGGCFRAKQVATYKERLRFAKVNNVGAEVLFRSRGYNIDKDLKKELSKSGSFIESYDGTEITKKEAQERLALIDKGQDPKLKVAVLVGKAYQASEMKKQFVYVSFSKDERHGSSSSGLSKEEREKQAIEAKKNKKALEIEEVLTSKSIIKKFKTKVLPQNLLRKLVSQLLEESGNNCDELIPYFIELGISFKATREGDDKSIVVSGPVENMLDLSIDFDEVEKIVSSADGEKLNILAAVAIYMSLYGNQREEFLKSQGVDLKAIAKQAKADAAAWWKAEQAKKKEQPAKTKTKKGGSNG
ncbi:MAG: ParB/RepB/Spo0J family partition protein [Flavobacteriales bacterium]|jgi:ParB/RepB/Spo0J family partition protein